MINIKTKEELTGILFSYYKNIKEGNLEAQALLMTPTSYYISLEALGYQRAFRNKTFKKLLRDISKDDIALKTIESVLSDDMATAAREHTIALVSFDVIGPHRITLHYSEDNHPKKLYFSAQHGKWLIDYKAGRRIY